MYRQPEVSKSNPLQRLPLPIKHFLSRLYWKGIGLVDFGAELVGLIPLHNLRIACYRHLLGVKIGKQTSIHRCCRFYHPSRVELGDHTVVNRGVLFDGRMGLKIGNNVSISEGSSFLTLEHDLDSQTFADRGAPIVVEDYAFVGANAIVLPGVKLGVGAAVGAGAVVTRDVEAYTIVAGVPARPIGMRSRNLTYSLNYRKLLG